MESSTSTLEVFTDDAMFIKVRDMHKFTPLNVSHVELCETYQKVLNKCSIKLVDRCCLVNEEFYDYAVRYFCDTLYEHDEFEKWLLAFDQYHDFQFTKYRRLSKDIVSSLVALSLDGRYRHRVLTNYNDHELCEPNMVQVYNEFGIQGMLDAYALYVSLALTRRPNDGCEPKTLIKLAFESEDINVFKAALKYGPKVNMNTIIGLIPSSPQFITDMLNENFVYVDDYCRYALSATSSQFIERVGLLSPHYMYKTLSVPVAQYLYDNVRVIDCEKITRYGLDKKYDDLYEWLIHNKIGLKYLKIHDIVVSDSWKAFCAYMELGHEWSISDYGCLANNKRYRQTAEWLSPTFTMDGFISACSRYAFTTIEVDDFETLELLHNNGVSLKRIADHASTAFGGLRMYIKICEFKSKCTKCADGQGCSAVVLDANNMLRKGCLAQLVAYLSSGHMLSDANARDGAYSIYPHIKKWFTKPPDSVIGGYIKYALSFFA